MESLRSAVKHLANGFVGQEPKGFFQLLLVRLGVIKRRLPLSRVIVIVDINADSQIISELLAVAIDDDRIFICLHDTGLCELLYDGRLLRNKQYYFLSELIKNQAVRFALVVGCDKSIPLEVVSSGSSVVWLYDGLDDNITCRPLSEFRGWPSPPSAAWSGIRTVKELDKGLKVAIAGMERIRH